MTYFLLLLVRLRPCLRGPARRRNSKQARAEIRRVDDCVVSSPASPVRNRSCAEQDHRAATQGNLAHLALCEKSHRLPIRREKRLRRVLRAGNGPARLLVERTQIKLLRFARNRGNKYNLRPIRRDRKGRPRIGIKNGRQRL